MFLVLKKAILNGSKYVCVCVGDSIKYIAPSAVHLLIHTRTMGRRQQLYTTFTCIIFVTQDHAKVCKVIICGGWGLNHSESWSHTKTELSLVFSHSPLPGFQVPISPETINRSNKPTSIDNAKGCFQQRLT